jgi:hypothetical protein
MSQSYMAGKRKTIIIGAAIEIKAMFGISINQIKVTFTQQ